MNENPTLVRQADYVLWLGSGQAWTVFSTNELDGALTVFSGQIHTVC
ncbi:MAG: hypothetical protein Q7U43_10000 [Methylococcaceae bacterium]|jgi:hypothetical protein|nr:hypothetical protein [Methylococcaceae bacterium]